MKFCFRSDPAGLGRMARALVLATFWVIAGRAVAAEQAVVSNPDSFDVLVFADGDRTRGKFLRREGDTIVFQSARFGELHVSAGTAKVIMAAPDEVAAAKKQAAQAGPAPDTAPPPGAAPAPETAPGGWLSWTRWTSPVAMAAALRDFFGPWHGRFGLASSTLTNTSRTSDFAVDMKVSRKWTNDEVKVDVGYDFNRTNDVINTDLMKANGSWRHDFSGKYFADYLPHLEWNRNFTYQSRPGDYVLLQQQLGVGVNLLNRDARKIRLGVAENIFDFWTLDSGHSSRGTESLFSELEFKLPWRITLNDRGVYYYSIVSGSDGWENKFELNKKLTETLSLALRHEYRRNNPDVRASDYSLWRLQLGFDF